MKKLIAIGLLITGTIWAQQVFQQTIRTTPNIPAGLKNALDNAVANFRAVKTNAVGLNATIDISADDSGTNYALNVFHRVNAKEQ